MGKCIKCLILIIVCALFVTVNCYAEPDGETMEEYLKTAPEEFRNFTASDIPEAASFNGLADRAVSALNSALGSAVGMFCAACCIVLLMTLAGGPAGEKEISGVVSAVCCTALTAVCLPAVKNNITAVSEAIGSVKVFSTSAVPVISSLAAAGGESFSAVTFSSSVSLCLSLFSFASESVLLPLCVLYLMLGLISGVSATDNTVGISALIKKAVKWCAGAVTAVLSLSLTLQKFLSSASDTVVKRSIRSAVGAFIPVVGSTLAGGVDSMFTLAANSKTSLSVLGIAIISFVFMPVIFNNVCCGGAMFAVRTLAGAFGAKRAERAAGMIADSFFMLSGVCAVGAFLVITSFLLICISV